MKKALLEFFLTEESLFLFIIRTNQPEIKIEDKEPLVFELNINRLEIIKSVEFIRNSIMEIVNASSIDIINTIKVTFLKSLGEKIFTEEVRRVLDPYDSLYIVPFGELHYLPIHALYYDNNYLIDQFVVAYLPSASLLPHVKVQDQFKDNYDLLAIGVDYTDNRKEFQEEAKVVGDLSFWKNRTILCRHTALKSAIIPELNNKKAVHFSTHGYFSSYEPMHSGLVLYSDDEVNEIKLIERENTDLILSAKDFIEFGQINSELVFLSGCVTGQSENHPGDELIGLSRGLIFSGVKSMILALFPTFKNATSQGETNISNFYKYWIENSMTKAQAFREYIRLIKSKPKFAHPLHWFSYIYIGSLDD